MKIDDLFEDKIKYGDNVKVMGGGPYGGKIGKVGDIRGTVASVKIEGQKKPVAITVGTLEKV